MLRIQEVFENLGLDFVIVHGGRAVVASVYHRSEQILRQAGAAVNLAKYNEFFVGQSITRYSRKKGHFIGAYTSYISPVRVNKEEFFHLLLISQELGENMFLTTAEKEGEDFYQLLMSKFKLPLMESWGEKLLRDGINKNYIDCPNCRTEIWYGANAETESRVFSGIPFEKIKVHSLTGYTEDILKQTIERLFEEGEIRITEKEQNPMSASLSMDEYFSRYGHTLVENLEKKLSPLCELKPIPDTVVLRNKKLYPQQAAMVNGVIELLDRRSNYAILAQGMGVGKVRRCGVRCDCNWNVA